MGCDGSETDINDSSLSRLRQLNIGQFKQIDEASNVLYTRMVWYMQRSSAPAPAEVKEEAAKPVAAAAAAPAPAAAAPAPAAKKAPRVDSDGFEMSSEDDEERLAIIAKKAAEKAEKNKGKPAVVARSSVILFVKPVEAETDMNVVAEKIKREVVMESLQWGDYELQPVAYGIMKLRIICVIEDEKIQLDDLTEAIEEFEEVQSVDIDAFNKI